MTLRYSNLNSGRASVPDGVQVCKFESPAGRLPLRLLVLARGVRRELQGRPAAGLAWGARFARHRISTGRQAFDHAPSPCGTARGIVLPEPEQLADVRWFDERLALRPRLLLCRL